jgi:hypothetical protein
MKTQNILIWAAIIGGGIYLYNRNKKKKETTSNTSSSPEEVEGIMNEEMAKVFEEIKAACSQQISSSKIIESAKPDAIAKCTESKFQQYMEVNTKIV